ncbi:ribonuclease H [Trifolium medium]|uniref:Ribonuclease H n=1 Tax=Trifolium medium TaxID=97028 RepID=A0A392MIC3_9FABA|nr:ribonuclease H [Trifolium medium]
MNLNIPSNLNQATVANLIDAIGTWNWNLLNDWVPNEVLRRLRSIPPPHDDFGADEMTGSSKHAADYAVTDMYGIICNFQHMETNMVWDRIWKLKLSKVECQD